MVYFAARAQIAKVPSSLLWAAQISGAARTAMVRRILLPMIFPGLLAGGFLAFAASIEEYGTPLVIGNRIGFPVIATEIGRLVRVYPINLGTGCVREGTILASLALIPTATPAITMAVGFIRAWNAPWAATLPLYGGVTIVGLFYTAQYLPYAVQYARAGMAIPPSYEWAARLHGASRGDTLARIVAPLLWPHCLAGAILIFSISFRELVGSVLLRPPGMETVSTFILREFDQGSPAAGMALDVIAIALSMLSVSLARRLVPRQR